jgi:signal transduction histidine kinase
LAIVKGIIEDHGGKIKVVSEINAGTTFHIFLPTPKARDKGKST